MPARAMSANGGALDGDTAVEALTFWLSMLPYAPPEATSSTWDEVASSFAAGPRRPRLGSTAEERRLDRDR